MRAEENLLQTVQYSVWGPMASGCAVSTHSARDRQPARAPSSAGFDVQIYGSRFEGASRVREGFWSPRALLYSTVSLKLSLRATQRVRELGDDAS